MNNKYTIILGSLLKNKIFIAGVGAVLSASILGGALIIRSQKSDNHVDRQAGVIFVDAGALPIETVEKISNGTADTALLSWPGEIMSFGDLVIYPPRDGTIVEWSARIGQWVGKGQLLGRLSDAPSTIDRSTAIAEQIKDLIRVRANQPATARIKDAEVQSAQAERDEAKSLVAFRQKSLYARLEEIFYRELRRLTDSINPQTQSTLRPKQFLGITNSQAVTDFEVAAQRLRYVLQKDSTGIPEEEVLAYLRLAEKITLDAIHSNFVSEEEIASLRDMVGMDKEKFVNAVNEYKEALTSLQVKEVILAQKMIERDQGSQILAGELQATEEAYGNVLSSLTNRSIIAPQSGTISSVVKNPGDFVTNDSIVATITVNSAVERFVRFRIPGNETLPKTGDQVVMVRPGFSLDRRIAKVTGVGAGLDTGGSYAAEASFIDRVDWPVHASVRVIPTRTDSIFVPLAAVWWDDDGHANVWTVNIKGAIDPRVVRVGRSLGDRVEVVEGLVVGDRYLAATRENLKPGDTLNNRTSKVQEPQTEKESSGDGHNHAE